MLRIKQACTNTIASQTIIVFFFEKTERNIFFAYAARGSSLFLRKIIKNKHHTSPQWASQLALMTAIPLTETKNVKNKKDKCERAKGKGGVVSHLIPVFRVGSSVREIIKSEIWAGLLSKCELWASNYPRNLLFLAVTSVSSQRVSKGGFFKAIAFGGFFSLLPDLFGKSPWPWI